MLPFILEFMKQSKCCGADVRVEKIASSLETPLKHVATLLPCYEIYLTFKAFNLKLDLEIFLIFNRK